MLHIGDKMNQNTHEIITFPNYFPLTMFISTIDNVAKHWHQSIEIIFILDGNLDYETINSSGHLAKSDCILFNT